MELTVNGFSMYSIKCIQQTVNEMCDLIGTRELYLLISKCKLRIDQVRASFANSL
jgi:hypothetical protein